MRSPEFFHFDPFLLQAVTDGRSPLDQGRLHVHSFADADVFLRAYGFDWDEEDHRNFLLSVYRRVVVFSQEQLKITNLPPEVGDLARLRDLRNLLIWASDHSASGQQLQPWACGLLRVMHVFIHIENDLSTPYAEEIQKQILMPFEYVIRTDGTTGRPTLLGSVDRVLLTTFEQKPFKTTTSTTLKLLAKPNLFTLNVFDKIGVRFVADSIFDVFRVLRILIQENLVSVPHIMADQSSNNLYPADLFCEVLQSFKSDQSSDARWSDEIKEKLDFSLNEKRRTGNNELFRKQNLLSSKDHRFMKFISRRLIRLPRSGGEQRDISFFYPFEIQILDAESYAASQRDESSHKAYKDRQRNAARHRAFPFLAAES